MILVDSKNNQNYTATVRRVSKIIPIENFDRLVYAQVGVEKVLVSKDEIHEGDIVVFVPQEASLADKYLKTNNLYVAYELNANYTKYQELMESSLSDEEKAAKAKSMHGYFGDKGRVTLLKIRGMYSQGYLASISSIERAYPQTLGMNWTDCIDVTFDFIGEDEFCHKYVVEHAKSSKGPKRINRKSKKAAFDYLIPSNFPTHYNTTQLRDSIQYLYPEDDVDITVKIHGTSFFAGLVKCNKPLSFWEKIKKFFGAKVNETTYRRLYSTRKVVVNRYEGCDKVKKSPYTECFDLIKHHLTDHNMIVYGEIFGYTPGTSKCIQKDHDYGCEKGKWAFMPYRIVDTNIMGEVCEYEIDDVINWTADLVTYLPDDKRCFIRPLTRVFSGKLNEIVPFEMSDNEHREDALTAWRAALYEKLQQSFGLEEDEPMCNNKVPREGIVIRKKYDIVSRAIKLKSNAHYALAKKAHDAGDADIEEDQETENE